MSRRSARPRVLLVIENVSFARDHRARKQAASLAAYGFEVSVICRRDAENKRFDGRDGVRIHQFPAAPESATKIGFVWEYASFLVAAFVLCCRVAVERGFDVIQVGSPPDTQFLLALPFRLFGKRLVVDQRDLSLEIYSARYGNEQGVVWHVLRRLERMSWRSAHRIVTVNASCAERIIERGGVSSDAVTIVGNGPRARRSAVPRDELKAGKRFLVLWLGLMGPQDHAELVLDAAQHVTKTLGCSDVQFILVGEGEELPHLRKRCAELDLADTVTFTGWLDEPALVEVLATADVGLDSNLQEEVTPVKGLEYMSFGVPLVAFDLRETRAMAGDAALYAPAGDARGLADRLVALLDDDVLRNRMSVRARTRIEGALSWDRQAVRYLSMYGELLGLADTEIRKVRRLPAAGRSHAEDGSTAKARRPG
jgi:glycosyltransferase involved in cell wall biosynthesis